MDKIISEKIYCMNSTIRPCISDILLRKYSKILNKKKLTIFDWIFLYLFLYKKSIYYLSCDHMPYDNRTKKYDDLQYQSKICMYRIYKKLGLKYRKLKEDKICYTYY